MTQSGINSQTQDTGTDLPEMKMKSTQGLIESPEDYIGQITILAFYPADGSPVCTNQLAVYNQALSLFKRKGANIYGISIDKVKSHERFANSLNLQYPLISDRDPFGGIAKFFGVFNYDADTTDRALIVLDKKGQIYWQQTYPDHINPGAEGIMKALDELEEREETE